MDKVAKVFMNYGIDEAYKAPSILMNILFDKELREKLFKDLLIAHDYDLSYDWFFEYFQDEHADRKNNHQDFTPVCVSNLMSEMLGCRSENDFTIIEEPAAGTGSTMIAHWYKTIRSHMFIWDYKPDDYLYKLTELSSKTVPFLLFNVMIRGMNALVIHGNSLTQEIENAYWVYNELNNPMGFSDLYIIPKERYHIFKEVV